MNAHVHGIERGHSVPHDPERQVTDPLPTNQAGKLNVGNGRTAADPADASSVGRPERSFDRHACSGCSVMVTGRSTLIDVERLHRDPSNSHSRPTAVIRLGDLIVQKWSLSLASVVRCDVQHRWRQVDAPFGNGSLTPFFVKVTEMREKLFLTRLAEDETVERQPALEPLQVYLIAG